MYKLKYKLKKKNAAKWSQTSYLVTTQSFGHNLNLASNQTNYFTSKCKM